MPVDVFISYRGADRVLARRLEQRLRSRWGSRVFRDETSLMSGRSWSEQLRAAMSQANVMLALIGPGWHVRDEGEDWVRDELLGAIEAGNPVLPVLVGDPDELRTRLGKLPEAFARQAVNVSGDLAGFDLHKIERALRDLGAFGERRSGGLGRELSRTLPARSDEMIEKLLESRSIALAGASGSGRSALLQRIADAATAQGGLVAACGTDLRSRSRRTHGVVASWVDDLCRGIRELPPEERAELGPVLVETVIEFGPDLLARTVLRPALLLPLGNDDSDQKILDAARRPNDRWAPFPPKRLVSQSESVVRKIIERFAERTSLPLTLIVDNVESIDGSSRDLVTRLLRSRPESVRLVLATSAVRESAKPEPAWQSVARALELQGELDLFEGFASLSLHDDGTWGSPGEIIQGWLDRHEVRLAEGVRERFESSNPYYALSALWYLVDNGHLVQQERTIPQGEDRGPSGGTGDDRDVVTWVPARPDEELVVPSRDRLLDHMIEEFIPVRFRPIVEVGSLIGRRFPFSAAFAVASPPESIDGLPPTDGAIERWRVAADEVWAELEKVDPDGSVIVCHRSADDERMISLAQVDLVTHLRKALDDTAARERHEQLARYFEEPIADDCGRSLDDRYRNARAAAIHWANAERPREAADAEREAAGLAEETLAYPEARSHYRRAIRLFTQLLAKDEHGSTVELAEHEDLLILASCRYRLGRMTRLAFESGSIEGGAADPTKHFRLALKHLRELTKNLHDKRLAVSASPEQAVSSRRDLPEPNVIRHYIRLCETLSGWINLERAEWHRARDTEKARGLLFDALRHAEAARGEADSRWLLAAASARLAQQLVADAAEEQQRGRRVRSHNLAIEAQFHVERVIGLAAVSAEEDRNLEEPRSRAWTVLGELFQTIAIEPQLAEWAFYRMNDHRHDVSDLVDMMTDRRLGLFLLSRHRGIRDDRTDEARRLLERHARWAEESGIALEHFDADLSLALLELVERSHERSPALESAQRRLDRVIADGAPSDAGQRQNARLLKGVLHAIEHADGGGVAHDHESVVSAFRNAGIDGLDETSADEDVLRVGWSTLLLRLLRWCPHLKERVGLDDTLRRPPERDGANSARRRFFSELALQPELRDALERADRYLESTFDESLVPSSDRKIWCLLESRVPQECYERAERTRARALDLLDRYRDVWDGDDSKRTLLRHDIAYAVAVHEWYRSTDPSRLLTLARESNMEISGREWASPKLLSGRLAVQVLDRQYHASGAIGRERLKRIGSMVTNWARGSSGATALEKIFYVAVLMVEHPRSAAGGGWRALLAERPERLSEIYRMAVEERESRVSQAGLGLLQDLHLLDAGRTDLDPQSGPLSASSGGCESSSGTYIRSNFARDTA